jgi:lipopolysaccharide export system permease protein
MLGLVVQQANQLGLSPAQTLAIIPLLIPYTLPYTIPTTTLFASCVVYGRLSADNEAIALKAAGVNLYTILRPAVLVGIITTCVTASLYYSLIPRTQGLVQAQVMQDPEEVLYNMLRKERKFAPPGSPFAIHVRDVQGRRLLDVIVKRRKMIPTTVGTDAPSPFEYDFVLRAQEAELRVDVEKRVLALDPKRVSVWGKGAYLNDGGSKVLEMDLPDMFTNKNAKAKPMALEWEELPLRIEELNEKRELLSTKRLENQQLARTVTDPELAKALANQDPIYVAQIAEIDKQIRSVRFEQHMRPALAVGCLCFALIGCPVGIWANRSDYLSTFVSCFLPTVFVYYPVLLAGGGLGRDGKLPMAVGVWAANVVAGLAALLLTVKLIRR